LMMLMLLLAGIVTLTFSIQIDKAIADSLSIGVSPRAGPAGTHVVVSVTGATPDGEVARLRFYFNDVEFWDYTYESRRSSWATGFSVPDV